MEKKRSSKNVFKKPNYIGIDIKKMFNLIYFSKFPTATIAFFILNKSADVNPKV